MNTKVGNRAVVLGAAAAHDAYLVDAFIRVAGLVAPPQSLMRPNVVLRVLRKGRSPGFERVFPPNIKRKTHLSSDCMIRTPSRPITPRPIAPQQPCHDGT
jgi:hypothetical protein